MQTFGTLTFTKKHVASEDEWDGTRMSRTPAKWWVILNGKRMGFLHSPSFGFYESSSWQFVFTHDDDTKNGVVLGDAPFTTHKRLRDAKEWLQKNQHRWVGTWFECYAGYASRNRKGTTVR